MNDLLTVPYQTKKSQQDQLVLKILSNIYLGKKREMEFNFKIPFEKMLNFSSPYFIKEFPT